MAAPLEKRGVWPKDEPRQQAIEVFRPQGETWGIRIASNTTRIVQAVTALPQTPVVPIRPILPILPLLSTQNSASLRTPDFPSQAGEVSKSDGCAIECERAPASALFFWLTARIYGLPLLCFVWFRLVSLNNTETSETLRTFCLDICRDFNLFQGISGCSEDLEAEHSLPRLGLSPGPSAPSPELYLRFVASGAEPTVSGNRPPCLPEFSEFREIQPPSPLPDFDLLPWLGP